MAEEIKTNQHEIQEEEKIIEEIKTSDDKNLKELISKWYEKTRTDGMKIGATYISYGIYAAIRKHTNKPGKITFRDYERCIKDIVEILNVQLNIKETEKNDSEEGTND